MKSRVIFIDLCTDDTVAVARYRSDGSDTSRLYHASDASLWRVERLIDAMSIHPECAAFWTPGTNTLSLGIAWDTFTDSI